MKGGSPIQFFDPRPQANVLHPNLKYTTIDNSGMMQFESEKGFGLIFGKICEGFGSTLSESRGPAKRRKSYLLLIKQHIYHF